MVLFFKILLTEFIAEMGDKTQLMLIALTSKYKLKDIILGTAAAILVLNGLAVLAGGLVSEFIPEWLIKIVAAFAFLYFAASTLAGDEDEEEEEGGNSGDDSVSVSVSLLLSEEVEAYRNQVLKETEKEELHQMMLKASLQEEHKIPVDWEYTDCPELWADENEEVEYNWYEEAGPETRGNSCHYYRYIPLC